MKKLRNQTITRIFALLTGVIFLNMSFFLAEVRMLDFQDKDIVENVRQLILNAGFEEERDGHAAGTDSPVKLFNIAYESLSLRHSSLFLIAARMYHEFRDHYLHADHSEIISPPPETVS